MAAPSYTTNLADFEDFEGAAPTPIVYTNYDNNAANKIELADTDSPIQSATHASSPHRSATPASIGIDNGANITWTSGWAFFAWGIMFPAGAVATDANGGLVMMIGTSDTAFYQWTVGGSDFGRYPYGGWQNFVADPEVTAGRTSVGGGAGTSYATCGIGFNITSAISKGSPMAVDVIRYGRGDIEITAGDLANGYATFSGTAAKNDLLANRWGLFQETGGSYLWKGLLSLGTATAVNFRDANRAIFVDNTRNVQPDFNRIEINNASSNVGWDAINITALGTVSKGEFECVDNATFSGTSCTFTDMDTFIFGSNSTVISSTFRGCGSITTTSGIFTSCAISSCVSGTSMITNDVEKITECTFTSDGSNHAVQALVAGDYDWKNYLSGYATSDGSTGNEAFYNDSAGHINLTVETALGYTRPYVRNGTSATTTVIIPEVEITISAPVTLVGAEIRIYDYETAPPDFGTELAGVESHDASTYVYNGTAANLIYIQIMKDGYEEFGQQYTIPSASTGYYADLKVDTNI